MELDRLQAVIAEKSQEIEDKDEVIRRYETRFSGELERLNGIVQQQLLTISQRDTRIKELESTRVTVGQPQEGVEQYKIEISNLKTVISELEGINMHTIAERDELFKMSHELQDKLEIERSRLAQTTTSVETEWRRRSELEVSALRDRAAHLEGALEGAKAEVNGLRIENTNLSACIEELERVRANQASKLQVEVMNREEGVRLSRRVKDFEMVLQSKQESVADW